MMSNELLGRFPTVENLFLDERRGGIQQHLRATSSDDVENSLDFTSPGEEDRLLFEQAGNARITQALRAGEKVWIKRYDVEGVSFGRHLHKAASPLLPLHFLRAPPVRDSQDMVRQELRKMLAFKSAGLNVPDPLCAFDTGLMLLDMGQTVQARLDDLRETEADGHDNLLIQCAEILGQAHEYGLCHGRPHPCDMFMAQGKIGFFDFEEEPEAVMPLAQAQARDVWLLFFQITTQAIDKKRTPHAAFMSWRRHTSIDTLKALCDLVRFFKYCVLPLKLMRPIWLGEDGKRMLNVMEFFITHLGLKKVK